MLELLLHGRRLKSDPSGPLVASSVRLKASCNSAKTCGAVQVEIVRGLQSVKYYHDHLRYNIPLHSRRWAPTFLLYSGMALANATPPAVTFDGKLLAGKSYDCPKSRKSLTGSKQCRLYEGQLPRKRLVHNGRYPCISGQQHAVASCA